VYLSKVDERLVRIRNKNHERFIEVLAMIDQTDEFIRFGANLAVFIARRSEEPKQFVSALGCTLDDVLILENDGGQP